MFQVERESEASLGISTVERVHLGWCSQDEKENDKEMLNQVRLER